MATNEEIMAVVKKTQEVINQSGSFSVEAYNALSESEKTIHNEWSAKLKNERAERIFGNHIRGQSIG